MAEEMKIPVFSVIKNGTILKNIFLNNPQWVSDEDHAFTDREDGPILIGRHPDCHIVLDHPSISRFHLEIRAEHALLKLSVTDRSSVHGTWVSGNKIQPNTPIDLTEGDTVKIGASTRVYSLHWIPLSSAFEMEDLLPAVLEESEELTHRMEISNEKILSVPSPEPLSLPIDGESRTPENNANANEVQTEKRVTPSSLLSRRSKSKSISVLHIQTGRETSSDRAAEVTEESSSVVTEPDKTHCKALLTELEKGKGEEEEEEEEEETFASDKENMTPLSSTSQKLKSNCTEMQTTLNSFAFLSLEDVLNVDKKSLEEMEEAFFSDKKNWSPLSSTSQKSKRNCTEMQTTLNSFAFLSLEDVLNVDKESLEETVEEAFFSDKENWSPLRSTAQKSKRNCIEMQTTLNSFAVLGLEDLPNVDEKNLEEIQEKAFCSEKENWTPEVPRELESDETSCRDLLTSNREGVDETGDSTSKTTSPNINAESEQMIETREERIPLQSLLENSPLWKQRMTDMEWIPFHSPIEKSPPRNGSPVNYAPKSADEGNMDAQATASEQHKNFPSQCEQQHKEGEKKQWNMVVDLECLLNEESRKSLKLLEALKGTHLIIPRIVIRELDCLKRRKSLLFRKERKAATSALQWIEECMAKCTWWIHVQSVSESTPVPATPPATPRSQLGDLMDIVSPTAEDHVLDCALLFKRIQDGEQLIVISDSIALKIKAMAEGLICETAKEFHASLVDPYSKRFLWPGSSPRGSIWSCLDEAALIGSYYCRLPDARKMVKPTDEVKGLKLILQHNSHCGNLDR